MLQKNDTVLVIVDVQGKLAQLMHEKDQLFSSLQKVVAGFQVLDVPIIWMEQLPDKLGPTISELSSILSDSQPIAKSSFSCCGNEVFQSTLAKHQAKNVVLVGIEAHICVYQTAIDLIQSGHAVTVIADAVSSRTELNKSVALQRMSQSGVLLSTTEMVLFELQRVAEGDSFKQIAKLVK